MSRYSALPLCVTGRAKHPLVALTTAGNLFICAKDLFVEAMAPIVKAGDMPLYWLCYRHNNQISVVIEPGASPIHARMRAALAGLDEGEFAEGHKLDRKWRVPKEMIGRRLSQEEAKRLLAKFGLTTPVATWPSTRSDKGRPCTH
jgi:hypothetical protein